MDIVLGVSIPVVSIVLVIILVLVIIYHRRCQPGHDYCLVPHGKPEKKKKDHEDPDVPPKTSPSTPDQQTPVSETPTDITFVPNTVPVLPDIFNRLEVTEKSILLLYYIDNPLHQNAAFLLADFLEEHCSMNVHLYDRCTLEIRQRGTDSWAVDKMEKVDWIVILNSVGAYNEFKNPKNVNPIQADSHILSDMFMCAMKMLERHHEIYTDKIISVYFPYTEMKHLIRQFTPKGIHYKLMDDIEHFFLHVQGCEKYHQKDVIEATMANEKEYHLTESGRKLKELISMMMNGQYTGNFLPTGVEADTDHQNNFDSGLESGFSNPFSGGWNGDTSLEAVFHNEDDEGSSFSLSLKDPDAWSNESIGSDARQQIKDFEMKYSEYPSNKLYDSSYLNNNQDVGIHLDNDSLV